MPTRTDRFASTFKELKRGVTLFQFFKKKEKVMSLSDYKQQYLSEKSTESIEALFKELKQVSVWVPFHAGLLDEKGGQEGARLKPDILQNGDDYFYPCFSNDQDIPKAYYDRFSWLQLPFLDCLAAAEKIERYPVKGIVLDAFSESIEIDKGAFEVLRQS